jgi:hypothetical protein
MADGTPGLTCDGADGTGNDHDGRDDRDVTMFHVVFVVVVAIVPGTREPMQYVFSLLSTW